MDDGRKILEWELLHSEVTPEHLGLIPYFVFASDPRPAKEQFNERYISGWTPFNGFKMLGGSRLKYPGDPAFAPLARTKLRDETILFYPHAWVVIMQPDGSFEACRMD
jgi:hypothetical protein